MYSPHTPEGSPPFSPSPEPIRTSRQRALAQSLYRELVIACESSLTLDVPEKPSKFAFLPEDTRNLYIAIRMHCETCISESEPYIGTTWADFRLVAISLKLIEWLDTEVLVQDVPKLTELMLTLRASLEGWVNMLVPGVHRSYFIEASMTRWDRLHAEMPAESPSGVLSPSQAPGYLAQLAAAAGAAASDTSSEGSVYTFRADDMEAWLAGDASFSEHALSPEAASPYSALNSADRAVIEEAERDARRRARYPRLFEVVRDMSSRDIWGDPDAGSVYVEAELLQDVAALHPPAVTSFAISWGLGSPRSTDTAWQNQPSPAASSPSPST